MLALCLSGERQRKVSSKEQLKLDVTVLGEDKVPDISEEEEVKVLSGREGGSNHTIWRHIFLWHNYNNIYVNLGK